MPSPLLKRLSGFESPCVPLRRMCWALVWAPAAGNESVCCSLHSGGLEVCRGGHTSSHHWLNARVAPGSLLRWTFATAGILWLDTAQPNEHRANKLLIVVTVETDWRKCPHWLQWRSLCMKNHLIFTKKYFTSAALPEIECVNSQAFQHWQ